jgi:hypothetical protein
MNPLTLAQILSQTWLVMISSVYAHLTPVDSYDTSQAILATDQARLSASDIST